MISYWNQITFANPWVFVLLAVPILMILWQVWRYKYLYPTLRLPILEGVKSHARPLRGFIKKYLFVLRVLGITAFIFALARPQSSLNEEEINTEGIDIVISLDISGSMEALDFEPDRLGAAKEKAREFIENRKNDRIGLVVFAGESFTQCPLTIDHEVLVGMLKNVKTGLIEQGTAIGMGLATAVIRLKESEAKSKVIILLTDGVNNSGFIDPLTAVAAAQEYGIRVYTIGVGKNGMAPFKVQDFFGNVQYQQQEVRIDEELLAEIAARTGGKYFQATSNAALGNVYQEIDRLEKTRIEVTRLTNYTEEFYWFLILGGILFLLEMILRYTFVRSIP
ncbi:MAG: VWA domain-containing protein [Bacteroidia bacterium]|nr:VWA domain-containing protein [Bacteroidia bacterium]